jgi:hypothetical protein
LIKNVENEKNEQSQADPKETLKLSNEYVRQILSESGFDFSPSARQFSTSTFNSTLNMTEELNRDKSSVKIY